MEYQYYITSPKQYTRRDGSAIVKLMVGGTIIAEALALIYLSKDLERWECQLNWDVRPIDLEEEQEEKIKEDCIEKSRKSSILNIY